MGALKMNSDELRNLGNKIISNATSFDGLISNFQNGYTAITAAGTWEGDDSTKFNQAASNFKADLDKATTLVREVGENLVRTADNYDSTFSDVSSSISGMLG